MPGVIKISPAVFNDKRDALAVAFNEGLRLTMEDMKFTPAAEPTDEQREFFSNTAYAEDDVALKRTILARIATHDTSVSPTPEQEAETVEFLGRVAEMIGPKHADYAAVTAMAESVKKGGARGEVEPGVEAEDSEEVEEPEVPEEAQAAVAGGNVIEMGLGNPLLKEMIDMAPVEKSNPNSAVPPPRPAVQPDAKRMDAFRLASAAARNAVNIIDADADDAAKERAYRLVLGTSATESAHGTDPNTNKLDNYIGQFQIGEAPFETQMGRIRRDPALKQRIKDAGMDPDKWTYADVIKPGVAAIIARLEYKKARPAIPEGDAEQAAYWKKYYSTTLDKKSTAANFTKKLTERVKDESAWDAYEKSLKKK